MERVDIRDFVPSEYRFSLKASRSVSIHHCGHRYAKSGICGACEAAGNPIPPTMIHHLHRACRYWRSIRYADFYISNSRSDICIEPKNICRVAPVFEQDQTLEV